LNSSLESFAPVAARIRRLKKVSRWGVIGYAISAGTVTFFKLPEALYWPVAAAGIVVLVISAQAILSIQCPACRASLNRATGRHCPECGSASLSPDPGLKRRRCSQCERLLAYRKGFRQFKVRYCSECGTHLHEQGV
jgi:predicted RNA-binding Zn-ribbon protein involved in translation (DUF1610 family)